MTTTRNLCSVDVNTDKKQQKLLLDKVFGYAEPGHMVRLESILTFSHIEYCGIDELIGILCWDAGMMPFGCILLTVMSIILHHDWIRLQTQIRFNCFVWFQIALMGPSGAGKSTLLDILACMKTEGTVTGRAQNVP